MAVSLGLGLSQGSPNEQSRTTTVTARVIINYSGGSYNGNKPSGTLTIDGQTFSFSSNFNYSGIGQGPSTTGSGSTTACTKTIRVSYGTSTTRTVSASASFASGTASGTVTASNSINLIPISEYSGSGDSGGGDTGGSGDGGDLEYPYDCGLNFIIGEHCHVKVYYSLAGDYLEPMLLATIKESTTLDVSEGYYSIAFFADDGYMISNCSVDGVACDGEGKLVASYGRYDIVASAVPSKGICIDNKLYECYIDTECELYTSYNANCTFEGHCYKESGYGGNRPVYSTQGYMDMGYYKDGYSDDHEAVYFLKVRTGDVHKGSKSLNFSIPIVTPTTQLTPGASRTYPVTYWLCSSDDNYDYYLRDSRIYDDPTLDVYGILSGEFDVHEGDESIDLTLDITDLASYESYYLILSAPPYDDGSGTTETRHLLGVPTVTSFDYFDEPTFIGSKFEKYVCCIDDGTKFEPYA